MTEQKVRRTSGSLERFIVQHQVAINQTVMSLGSDLYIVRTSAVTDEILNEFAVSVVEIRAVQTVSGDAINNELWFQRENVKRDLVGRWNIAIDLQREQAARDAFEIAEGRYARYLHDHQQVDENGEVIA